MNKKKICALYIGSTILTAAVATAIAVPIVVMNQDKNVKSNFNNLVNTILDNKDLNYYKADNKILPEQLSLENITKYTNLPKESINDNIKILYIINSIDNNKGIANISINLENATNNVTISDIEISGFRTYFSQLHLNISLFSGLTLQGNEKLLPSFLTSDNIEANLENLPSALYGVKYNFVLSDPNDTQGTITMTLHLSIANLSWQEQFTLVKGFLSNSLILTKQIFKNPDLIFQNFNNLLDISGWKNTFLFANLNLTNDPNNKPTANAFNPNAPYGDPLPTAKPFDANVFSSATANISTDPSANHRGSILTLNFITNKVFGFSRLDYISNSYNYGYFLVPIGSTISISIVLKNYNLSFNSNGEVNFAVSSSGSNINLAWPMNFVISKAYYFTTGILSEEITNQNYINENKSKAITFDNMQGTVQFLDSGYQYAQPFKLNY